MKILEIILISAGLSLDVFAVMICEGALLGKVVKKQLAALVVIYCIWQQIMVILGNLFTLIPVFSETSDKVGTAGDALSVLILIALGGLLIYKAFHGGNFYEHVKVKINYKQTVFLALLTSLDAFFAGIGFGFLGAKLLTVSITLAIATAIAVVAGIYTGYRLGYEQRTKAYVAGGIILFIAAVDVMIHCFM